MPGQKSKLASTAAVNEAFHLAGIGKGRVVPPRSARLMAGKKSESHHAATMRF
jgi:hypothetical protein